jgi:hypothetical protein
MSAGTVRARSAEHAARDPGDKTDSHAAEEQLDVRRQPLAHDVGHRPAQPAREPQVEMQERVTQVAPQGGQQRSFALERLRAQPVQEQPDRGRAEEHDADGGENPDREAAHSQAAPSTTEADNAPSGPRIQRRGPSASTVASPAWAPARNSISPSNVEGSGPCASSSSTIAQ